jgi:2-iminobutanoate/2-iminopropanoate deaminase
MAKSAVAAAALMALTGSAAAQSPNGVKTLAPAGAIKTTGTWDLGARAGDFVYVAGMRGIDPATNTLVQGDEARIRQAFLNMQMIAASEGATLRDCVRMVVYVTDMFRFRPLVNKVQQELWGQGPYPPRTIVEVQRLKSGRHFRGRGHLLRADEKVTGRAGATPWARGDATLHMVARLQADGGALPDKNEGFHGDRAIHRQ